MYNKLSLHNIITLVGNLRRCEHTKQSNGVNVCQIHLPSVIYPCQWATVLFFSHKNISDANITIPKYTTLSMRCLIGIMQLNKSADMGKNHTYFCCKVIVSCIFPYPFSIIGYSR